MIPALREILAACRYLERRFRWEEPLEEDVVEVCHDEARRLAERPADGPAALFYAFSRPVFLADEYTILPIVLCRNNAEAIGCRLVATRFALVDLKHEVSAGLHTFDDVRTWFEPQLVPRAQRA